FMTLLGSSSKLGVLDSYSTIIAILFELPVGSVGVAPPTEYCTVFTLSLLFKYFCTCSACSKTPASVSPGSGVYVNAINLSSPVEIKLVPSFATPKPTLAIKTTVLISITIHLCASDQRNIFLYPLPTMPKDVSFFLFIPFLKNVALKEGTIVIETSNDANKLNAIASANGLN